MLHKTVLLLGLLVLNGQLITSLHAAIQDTVRILALRVEFVKDDDDSTSGDGTFQLDTTADYGIDYTKYPYDPPPHNKKYFADHLQALSTYYQTISRGKLHIIYSILPDQEDSVFHLPKKMSAYYSKLKSRSINASEQQLIEIAKAVFQTVDSVYTDSINYDSFQSFIIFHAGVDGRTDFDHLSPSDIPSKYVSLTWHNDSIVTADSSVIHDFILMPEMVGQDGYIGVLNATLAFEFGHQLGLPSLFFTDISVNFGVPAAGIFSLMDIGATILSLDSMVYGTIPPHIGPWEKTYLGWLTPYEITSSQTDTFTIFPMETYKDSTLYKVPIHSDEYFLIEYRKNIFGADKDSLYVFDPLSKVILHPVQDTITGDSIYLYDGLLPGSGILIWHVDETRFEKNRRGIMVNSTIFDQGIDVEEADGKQEISFFLGAYGKSGDFFQPGMEFTPVTLPNANSNTGAHSGISIRFIDSTQTKGIRFTVQFDGLLKGWPVTADSLIQFQSPVVGDLDKNDTMEVVVTSSSGKVYGWKHSGKGMFSDSSNLFAQSAAPILSSPALGDINGNGVFEVVVGDSGGNVFVWQASDRDSNGKADILPNFPIILDGSIFSHPVVAALDNTAGMDIIAGTSKGSLYLLNVNGIVKSVKFKDSAPLFSAAGDIVPGNGGSEIIAVSGNGVLRLYTNTLDSLWERKINGSIHSAPVIGDLNRDISPEIIISTKDSIFVYDNKGVLVKGWPVWVAGGIFSPLALSDLDSDGYLDILVGSKDKMYALNKNGYTITNYPVKAGLPGTPAGSLFTSPLIGVDAVAKDQFIISGSSSKDIYAYDKTGKIHAGWPYATARKLKSTPVLSDMDGDGMSELIAVDDGGSVYVWEVMKKLDHTWPMLAADVSRTGYFDTKLLHSPLKNETLAYLYNYPNPINEKETAIRYYVGDDVLRITIIIFDVAGDIVEKIEGNKFSKSVNETPWNVDGIQSGVYLCRVHAKTTSGGSKVRFCRIAVVK